ncbi:hypothetical protein [Porphyrobacter sp. GA68]|uniref:hypothetical protein n=1 Tax=Porphyrobacter sp. GA68 TaxID=2883480 RepID=UPI001D181501|nr:hypothetical protein [Porphyrobacter sp. GA68]
MIVGRPSPDDRVDLPDAITIRGRVDPQIVAALADHGITSQRNRFGDCRACAAESATISGINGDAMALILLINCLNSVERYGSVSQRAAGLGIDRIEEKRCVAGGLPFWIGRKALLGLMV